MPRNRPRFSKTRPTSAGSVKSRDDRDAEFDSRNQAGARGRGRGRGNSVRGKSASPFSNTEAKPERGARVENSRKYPGKKFPGKGNAAKKFGSKTGAGASAETLIETARFSELVLKYARAAKPEAIGPSRSPEALAKLDYALELEVKNRALQEFWTAHRLPDKPNRILPSPKPRHYRTTTKRRVVFEKGHYHLDFLPGKPAEAERLGAISQLEPLEHSQLYAFLIGKLNQPAYKELGQVLNYLIIRGDYARFTVLFNVNRLNANVVRKAKLLGDHLQEMDAPKVVSAFLFFDPTQSTFYMDQRSPDGPWKLKKLFGPDDVRFKVRERLYAFHPTAFCQVNGSILPVFLEKAEQLLKARPEQRLLDLYCGFGFFGLELGSKYTETIGIEAAGVAIESAIRMATQKTLPVIPHPSSKATPASHAKPTADESAPSSATGTGKNPAQAGSAAPKKTGRLHFKGGRIRAASLDKLLPPPDQTPEAILLDPPRQGTEPGVIRALASRQPMRILHIFCDMDTLPREVSQWRKSGYMVSKVVPLDMFPGTDNLEVMVLFIPDRYGILNRIDKKPPEGYTGPHHGGGAHNAPDDED